MSHKKNHKYHIIFGQKTTIFMAERRNLYRYINYNYFCFAQRTNIKQQMNKKSQLRKYIGLTVIIITVKLFKNTPLLKQRTHVWVRNTCVRCPLRETKI